METVDLLDSGGEDGGGGGGGGGGGASQEHWELLDGERVNLDYVLYWFDQVLPYALLVFCLFLYQHRTGIATYLWLTLVMFHTDNVIRQQVALKQSRQPVVLIAVIASLSFHILLAYYLFSTDDLWRGLIFMMPPSESFWNVLWIVVLNDTMVRYVSMILKAFAIWFVGHLPPFKRKAQLYMVIERIFEVYRALLPVPLWFRYFLGDTLQNRVFHILTAGMYVALKISSVVAHLSVLFAVVDAYFRHQVRFGTHASAEQIAEVGDMCAICQEKMKDPIALPCNHIFCEECCGKWFERERTCPLCRTVVQTASGFKMHSDGSTPLLPNLF
eukprot:TRINITY_DN8435_c0_g1_i1.p1 TRINITY_DN8435_c0_g1~~TRINITY_DN8435_c0_g1_i1.p1  ORF type:complete len:351 (+),score=48.79 TRINITY_DN8435_c0_g1_i1:69-1055(+)